MNLVQTGKLARALHSPYQIIIIPMRNEKNHTWNTLLIINSLSDEMWNTIANKSSYKIALDVFIGLKVQVELSNNSPKFMFE